MNCSFRKKRLVVFITLSIVVFSLWYAYKTYFSPTKIAVVSFPGFTVEKMMRANTNKWVKIVPLKLNELDKIKQFSLALIRGHGIRISHEQLTQISNAGRSGVKIYVADITNPEYDLTNIKGKELDYITDLMENKGSQNFKSLFNYTRSQIDKKKIFLQPFDSAVILPNDYFFHTHDEKVFKTVKAYEKYYKKNGYYKAGRPKVALLAGNINMQNSNTEHTIKLIKGLENQNLNVYPIRSFGIKKLEMLQSCNPDIVLLRPHGRIAMGYQEKAVKWLKEQNIPVLTPLTVYEEYDKWLKNPQGLFGGMLSMNVVMPEIDGAVAPYAVVAQYKNEKGNLIFDGINNRIDNFCELTAKWAQLQQLKNKDKKVAIYYFKGPGKNALIASNLEVIPSLYYLLKQLKKKGYNLEGLPPTKEQFEKIIMQKGPVLGPYALGAFDNYLKHGNPVLVEKKKYETWCSRAMPKDLYAEVVKKYGEAPGNYMKVEKNEKEYIAVTCVKFGNICLLPQPLPGIGNNEQQLVHGANSAPPHTYIASYLWARFDFNANAIFHFGTHGSLEFTPGKQVALSDYDWADRLIGTTPHFYNYTISNIGEGIIAKRRSYATLISYLTPPFMKSGLHKDLKTILDKLDRYYIIPQGPVKKQYALSIKKLAEKQNIHRTLNLDSTKVYDDNDIHKIHEYFEEIEEEKVTAGMYTMGIPYTQDKLENTALLMSVDPVAFSMAEIDLMRNKINRQQYSNAMYISENYRPKATKIIQQAMRINNTSELLKPLITAKEHEMAKKWQKEHKDINLMSLMMSYGKKEGKQTNCKADTSKLASLIIKLCSNNKNRTYIERLKSDKTFKKTSDLLDPIKRKKAVKIAEKMKIIAPQMHESISIANQPDMLELLQIMQDSLMRNYVFKLISDNQLAEKIETQKKENLKQKAKMLDRTEYRIWFSRIYDVELKENIKKMPLEELKAGLIKLNDFQVQTDCFSYCENKLYSQKLLNTSTWNQTFTQAKAIIEKEINDQEKRLERYAKAILKLENTITNAVDNKINLAHSPQKEIDAILNALKGGYTVPSSGGDPVANPLSLPTGRNIYSIDAQRTPSDEAWKVGKKLAISLLEKEKQQKKRYPQKISFTLWSTNFISTEGATIAQILYLLGVEPVRDGFGTVRNLKLISIEELGRPRIDVVVQTSGQLRDLAASRLELINKAIALVAEANEQDSLNYVKKGLVNAEKYLLKQGFSPIDARKFASKRIFGGVNGNYGTGIMGLVEKGDAWDNEKQLAKQYIKNMGAIYDNSDNWGTFREGVFEAALQNTETIVQPRSGNTWGPLSLDHVYEFMGGINLAVRNVTGNDPTAYFNDFRNVNRPQMQELKEAIGIETNSTIFNPKYIKEMLQGEASSMDYFAETFRNTYGWNVMKPNIIDDYIWNTYYDIYVNDKHRLNIRERFETENPYALQEMTSVMLETARKGYWKATEKQLRKLAQLHVELIKEHRAGCSGFVCDNIKLRNFISQKLPDNLSKEYSEAISEVRNVQIKNKSENLVLKKNEKQKTEQNTNVRKPENQRAYSIWILSGAILIILIFYIIIKRKNKYKE